jgi:hypothetical protein
MADTPKDRQQWIYDLLKLEPNLSYNDCFTKYLQNFTNSRVTFTKDWNIANDKANEYQIKANKAKDDISIDAELKAFKERLNDKDNHARLLLSQIDELKIIKAGVSKESGYGFVTSSYSDEIRAKSEIRAVLKQLGDWYGFNAPTKIAETDSDGNDKLKDSDLKEFAKLLNK